MNDGMLNIEKMIYSIRGSRVMLDADLAKLYQVETKRLIEQVKRNLDRFPDDFMFQLSKEEARILKNNVPAFAEAVQGRKFAPYVFTENGVAMLSGILHSPVAIKVNIAIMRIFTTLRSYLLMEDRLNERLDKFEKGTNHLFKIVFERLDYIEDKKIELLSSQRKRIGLKN